MKLRPLSLAEGFTSWRITTSNNWTRVESGISSENSTWMEVLMNCMCAETTVCCSFKASVFGLRKG